MSAIKKEDEQTHPSVMGGDGQTSTQGAPTSLHLVEDPWAQFQIGQLFKLMVSKNASDMHLSVGSPPVLRLSGDVVRVKLPPLHQKAVEHLVGQVLTDIQKVELRQKRQIDLSIGIKGLARFRCNIFHQQGNLAAVFRTIPSVIPDFDALGLPKVLLEITKASSGLILVTGPTGSGKSTTLASIIDRINQEEPVHIVTLEDPIEFVYTHKQALINQREVGHDVPNFGLGLRALLRQDPDVVLVGELRDPETVEAALTIAETGHLVFGTLHTNSTVQTIHRIINIFPADKQDQVRNLLSFVLQGVVAQQLIPKVSGGRVLVQELLRSTTGIKNLIRENKIHQIYSQMQIGQEDSGMFTMNQRLKKLLDQGDITVENCLGYSNNLEEMEKMLKKGSA